MRQFNDLGVNLYGINCTLYIPNNLTTLEPTDMYQSPDAVAYTEYRNQKVWFQWYDKALVKLRKANAFAETEAPITARFNNEPQVIVNSYIVLPTEYENNQYKTLEFECVNVILDNTYDIEVYRKFFMQPRRAKSHTGQ
jgi:hypothetical protein